MHIVHTDCLVIGTGLAGSIYALRAAASGASCVVVSGEQRIEECNSAYAQGGIVYDDGSGDGGADRALFFSDIATATADSANPIAVDAMLDHGARLIDNVLVGELDVGFDRDADGGLSRTREAAHSKARIIYAKDRTGRVILDAAHARLREIERSTGRIVVRSNAVAIDLLTLSHNSVDPLDKYRPLTCIGAYVLDTASGEVYAVVAKRTVLATGGIGRVYQYSTNGPGAFGHGLAMAYRIGARIIDMEYIQFHPTVFSKEGTEPFLISEAVRGEGGVLVDASGRAFMDDYHPLKSLAPRDVIARSINSEMIKTGAPSVFIDLTSRAPDYIRERFPTIFQRCLQAGIDITTEPIPVTPAAHYLCGGIHADASGSTNIPGLTAIGETACTGLHGANRLASTSLLECLTMGALAADRDVGEITGSGDAPPEVRPWQSPNAIADEDLVAQDIGLLRNTMWNYVGLVRSTRRLARARRIIRELREEVDSFYAGYAPTKPLINLRNGVQASLLVVYAAIHNKQSIGSHFRDDSIDIGDPITGA